MTSLVLEVGTPESPALPPFLLALEGDNGSLVLCPTSDSSHTLEPCNLTGAIFKLAKLLSFLEAYYRLSRTVEGGRLHQLWLKSG